MSVYNDKHISLKDLALTQFELAREIPAALELIASKPQNLDIQTRMLIIRINAALHNLKSIENISCRSLRRSLTSIAKILANFCENYMKF